MEDDKSRKIVPETVGHVPKELSRATWFFLMRGRKISGSVFEEKYRPSAIPKGGLEIMLEFELKIKIAKERFLKGTRTLLKIIMKILIMLVNTQSMI